MALGLRALFFEGLWGTDAIYYVRWANGWDHVPAQQFELRLVYSAFLRGSIALFGNGEVPWALPGIFGSLLSVTAAVFCATRLASPGAGLAAGLLAASLPGDVLYSTVPLAGSLATGVAAWGTALLLAGRSPRAAWGGLALLALAMLTHHATFFLVAALMTGRLLLAGDRAARFRCAGQWALSVALFLAADALLFTLVAGAPLHEFRVLAGLPLQERNVPVGSLAWFAWPLRCIVFHKEMGAALLLCGLAAWRWWPALPRPLRALALTIALYWLWIGYGSTSPHEYQPFWRNAKYGQNLTFAVATVLAGAPRLGGPLARRLVTGLLALHLAILSSSGSWGQGVDLSRELLDWTREHPDTLVLTDDQTWREMHTLEGCRAPANVRPLSRAPATNDAALAIALNPLNHTRVPPGFRLGPTLHATAPVPRTFAAWLPDATLAEHPWLVRRPAGRILRLLPR